VDDWAFRSDGNQVNQSLFYFISLSISCYLVLSFLISLCTGAFLAATYGREFL
jgi:hypothetical protein